MDIPAPGATPTITVLPTAQFRWQAIEIHLQVESDLDHLIAQLSDFQSHEVIQLQVSGRIGLEGQQQLQQAIGAAEARTRHLQVDLSELQLTPSDEDIASLQADGYLAEVIAELREAAQTETGQASRDALAILAGQLMARTASKAATGAAA